jgi:hypothetical protein
MRALRSAIGIALLLTPAPAAWSIDPTGFEVMGIRLYMTSAETLTILRMQTATLTVQDHPCARDATQRCVGMIEASLPDGRMVIRFADIPAVVDAGSELAYSITLSVMAGGRITAELLRGAAVDHYGPPTAPATMTWCRILLSYSDDCDPNQPLMRLDAGEGLAGVLTLTDLGLPRQLRRVVGAVPH